MIFNFMKWIDSLDFSFLSRKPGYCGIAPFLLSENHPFNNVCIIHDNEYINQMNWKVGSKEIDLELLHNMLVIAHSLNCSALKKQIYIIEAYIFYCLARIWGITRYCLVNYLSVTW